MFGLRNKNGSCWINAALQAVFRIPELQTRFSEGEEDNKNPVETTLAEIWGSKGDEGLRDFYESVRTTHMPAGEGIGDSHELIEFLCDRIPFLDTTRMSVEEIATRIMMEKGIQGRKRRSHEPSGLQ